MHRPSYLKSSDAYRPSAAKRGYGRKWQAASAAHLRANPWCVRCLADGKHRPATQVDHSEPHRGDMKLFWDKSKWQGLCAPCGGSKSRDERITVPLAKP